MRGVDHRSHGGRTRELALEAGIAESELLDFSANLNPAGPPPWLREAIEEGLARVAVYPDPDEVELRAAAARRYGIPADRFLFADGAESLILALPRALDFASVVYPLPSYSGYARAAQLARIPAQGFRLDPHRGFSQDEALGRGDFEELLATLPEPSLLFLGSPNNPAGGRPSPELLRELLERFPSLHIALDESFAELAGDEVGELGNPEPRLLVIRSLTKTWALPGARLGFVSAQPELVDRLRSSLGSWPLSSFAEALARRALGDKEGQARSAAQVGRLARDLLAGLAEMGGLEVFPSGANFLLLKFARPGGGWRAAQALLRRGIAMRTFEETEGLDADYARIAVRSEGENARFLTALRVLIDEEKPS